MAGIYVPGVSLTPDDLAQLRALLGIRRDAEERILRLVGPGYPCLLRSGEPEQLMTDAGLYRESA